ncbi:hypothetical protein LTR37_012405 [Vermiconidia calcicola]|uniref:Uncharacterized protein n=1 Tax=Vermiconidia calcicola TaxID=1690605 RepID=A0ACC3N080_9PEZI|nr:hypothetical protein LTR37_012405 [Vermiconidia calcicola]
MDDAVCQNDIERISRARGWGLGTGDNRMYVIAYSVEAIRKILAYSLSSSALRLRWDLMHVADCSIVILANYFPQLTSKNWIVGTVGGIKLGGGGRLYFELVNGVNSNCDGCSVRTPYFNIQSRQESITSPSPTNARTTAASQTAAAQETTNVAGPAAGAAAANGPNANGQNYASSSGSNSRRVGLGVGLGLVIPLLLALILIFLFMRRRQKRKEQHRSSFRPSDSESWTQDIASPEMTHERHSGHGSYRPTPSGVWEREEYVGSSQMRESNSRPSSYRPTASGEWKREEYAAPSGMRQKTSRPGSYRPMPSGEWVREESPHDEEKPRSRNRESGTLGLWQPRKSSSSQHSNPFRPKSGAPSNFSRRSFFEPFEFEKPHSRDQNELDQVRRSIHGDLEGDEQTARHQSNEIPYNEASFTRIRRKEVPPRKAVPRKAVDSQDSDMSFAAGTDISTLSGSPEQPQPVHRWDERSRVHDGRDWPLA